MGAETKPYRTGCLGITNVGRAWYIEEQYSGVV